jgi:hypothetical protein
MNRTQLQTGNIDLTRWPFRCRTFDSDAVRCGASRIGKIACSYTQGVCHASTRAPARGSRQASRLRGSNSLVPGAISSHSAPNTLHGRVVGHTCSAGTLPVVHHMRELVASFSRLVPPGSDPRDLLLTREQLHAGIAHGKADCRLRRFAHALEQVGPPLKVVIYGTSISAGNHCEQYGPSFVELLEVMLRARYRHRNVTVSAYAYPGASPVFMYACIDSMLPVAEPVSLYIVELADNMVADPSKAGADLERILAALRYRDPEAALVVLSPWQQFCTRRLKRLVPFQHLDSSIATTRRLLDECFADRNFAWVMEAVPAAHNLTSLSARRMVQRALFRSHNATDFMTSLLIDHIHPTFRGHFALAQLVQHAVRQAAVGSAEAVGCPISPALQGVPMFATGMVVSPKDSRLTCAMGIELQRHVLQATGWRYTVERSSQGHAKPGYVAADPGATLDVCFRPESLTGRNYWQVWEPVWCVGEVGGL